MQYTLPPLQFAYDALEPSIDTQTMQIHHTKHHQTYVDKLNAALATHPEVTAASLEELLQNITALPEDIQKAVRNHGGGHSNHSLFWSILSPEKKQPSEALQTRIAADFGSFDSFVTALKDAAVGHFGSGWAWLVQDASGKLLVRSTPNQDSPYMDQQTPILGIDVWEHAYYLKYQNKRPDYIEAILPLLNWEVIEKRIK